MPHLVLYDGLCGLCNRTVQAILKRDRAGMFRFASLQGETGRQTLERSDLETGSSDTIVLVVNHGQPSERILVKSAAVLFIARKTGGWFRLFLPFESLPGSILDRAYDTVARNRYRWFGKYDCCPLPEERYRDRFLDR